MFGQPQSQAAGFEPASQSHSNTFAAAAAKSQSSLFDAPAAASQPSLFGASAAASQPSLFGASSAPSQPSLFGASSTSSQPASFGVFGAQSATQPAPLFGSAAPASQPSLFGAPPAATKPSLFGAQASSSQPSLFGGAQPATSLFGTAAQPGIGQFAQNQLKLPDAITDIVEKLNPSHPDSQFRTTLYKVEKPELVPLYQRPAGMSEHDYAEAQANNPDPSRLVPVQAKLFDDLLGRAEAQETRVKQNNAILLNIQRTIADIESSVEADLQPRLAAYRRRHRELARRVLHIATRVELAACRNDAVGALSAEEVDHKRRLEAISQALTAPGVFKYKLCDLVELSHNSALENKMEVAGDLRDPRAAAAVKTLLTEQLSGIQHLSEVCGKVKRDTEIIADALSTGGS